MVIGQCAGGWITVDGKPFDLAATQKVTLRGSPSTLIGVADALQYARIAGFGFFTRQYPMAKNIQAIRGMHDVLPAPESTLAVSGKPRCGCAGVVRLPRDPDAGPRNDRTVQTFDRRGDGHRRKGDVHVRRPQR